MLGRSIERLGWQAIGVGIAVTSHLFILGLIALGGCQPSSGNSPGVPPFEPEDLPELVVQSDEAPKPFALYPELSGYVTVTRPPEDPTADRPVLFDPRRDFYLYRNLFTLPDFVGAPRIPEGTAGFLSHAVLYPDENAAARGFQDSVGGGRPPGFVGLVSEDVPILEPNAAAFHLPPDADTDYRADYVVWLRGNVVVSFLSQDVPFSEIRSLAETLDGRISRRLSTGSFRR
jgi:hypothetical protein